MFTGGPENFVRVAIKQTEYGHVPTLTLEFRSVATYSRDCIGANSNKHDVFMNKHDVLINTTNHNRSVKANSLLPTAFVRGTSHRLAPVRVRCGSMSVMISFPNFIIRTGRYVPIRYYTQSQKLRCYLLNDIDIEH